MAALAEIVEPTLAGLGFELVDMQLSNHGQFLRLFIDRPEGAGGINVDDCATVSRHLMHLFAVEGVEYDRLEVSSPGLDRPLRTAAHFARFAGAQIDLIEGMGHDLPQPLFVRIADAIAAHTKKADAARR